MLHWIDHKDLRDFFISFVMFRGQHYANKEMVPQYLLNRRFISQTHCHLLSVEDETVVESLVSKVSLEVEVEVVVTEAAYGGLRIRAIKLTHISLLAR